MSYKPRVDPSAYAREKTERNEKARLRREESKSSLGGDDNNNSYYSPNPRALNSFFTGPLTPNGFEFDPASFEQQQRLQSQPKSESDRPATCMSISPNGQECCIGSSDHAGYTFSTKNATPLRRLYSRNAGHTDWLTSVCYLQDSRILTAGMDGKLCLWRRGGSDCMDLSADQGSISIVKSISDTEPVAISAGYDGTVCIWNCSSHSPITSKIGNARKQLPPLTAFAYSLGSSGSTAMTGSNNGLLSLWDLRSQKCTKAAIGKHSSTVNFVLDGKEGVFFTASIDGKIGLFDTRTTLGSASGNDIGATLSVQPFMERGRKGSAPISGLVLTDDGNTVVCSGGNELILLDVRKNLSPININQPLSGHQKPIVSLCLNKTSTVCYSGAMDGMVICHDLQTMRPMWGVGANKLSAGLLGVTEDRLVVSGDDGHALVYDF